MLLRLGEAHEEAEAALVVEALLQPLKEGLSLTERVTVFAKLAVTEMEKDGNAVPLPLADTANEAEADKEDDALTEASSVLVLQIEEETVYEGAVEKDGERLPVDVGESSPEGLASPDDVEETDPKRLPVGEIETVIESLLKKEGDAKGVTEGDAEASVEAEVETVRAPVALPDAESQFAVVDAAVEGVAKLLTLELPESETVMLSDCEDVPVAEPREEKEEEGDAEGDIVAIVDTERDGVGEVDAEGNAVAETESEAEPHALLREEVDAEGDSRADCVGVASEVPDTVDAMVTDTEGVSEGDTDSRVVTEGDTEEVPHTLLRADADADGVEATVPVDETDTRPAVAEPAEEREALTLWLTLPETEKEPLGVAEALGEIVAAPDADTDGVLEVDAVACVENEGDTEPVPHALL